MTVYEGVKILKGCGWWDILKAGVLVNPSVERYIDIYETFLDYVNKGGGVTDSELWTADDYEISERWVRQIRQKLSAPLPEGALFSVELLGVG